MLNTLNSLVCVALIAFVTWWLIGGGPFTENFLTNSSTPYYGGAPYYGESEQGDLVLRNLYRQIHNLEAVSRYEVSQNNDHAGGNHNISKERLVMERIAQQIAKLKRYAREEIARKRLPVKRTDLPPLGYDFDDCYYNDCQLKMDHNERILGIPSAPGSIHTYHYRRNYETNRIPAESPYSEDMHMV